MKNISRNLNNIRLALFPIAYALGGVLIGSTLNRIMIADLGYSATLVAFFFALPLLVSPVRIWIGYRSDAFSIFGKRREPYIMLGAVIIGLGILAITNLIIRPNNNLIMAGVGLAFLLYGLGRNISHNTFQALVADRYSGDSRSRAATLYEVATMLGMVMGAGIIKGTLKVYDPAQLTATALGVAVVILALALLGTIGQEEKDGVGQVATMEARKTNFARAFKSVILADPQARLFFVVVVMTFIGTLAQDVLLEPYGGLVLKMAVGETTGLTQFWGIGVLISMVLCGVYLLKAFGFMMVMRAGMLLSALSFLGPIAAGISGSVGLLKGSIFVMGLGTGLAGAGMLSGTLAFTSKIRAGMLLGVWGVANMVGHAFGSLMGGMIVDGVRAATGNAFVAYATVFVFEILILLAAFSLTYRLRFEASEVYTEEKRTIAAC